MHNYTFDYIVTYMGAYFLYKSLWLLVQSAQAPCLLAQSTMKPVIKCCVLSHPIKIIFINGCTWKAQNKLIHFLYIMCMFTCLCVYYLCVCAYACVYMCMCGCFVCVCVCSYVYADLCMRVCVYISMHAYVCANVC